MPKLKRSLSTTIGKVVLIFILLVLFIAGGILLYSVFREDKEPVVEDVYVPKTGDTWEETQQGIVSLKFADTLVIDIYADGNVISYQCGFSDKTTIKDSENSEINIDDVEPGDRIEINMSITQLEEEAQERSCNDIILIKEDAYNEEYLQD